jgi:coenzyme F420 hydrogenase subunit delta
MARRLKSSTEGDGDIDTFDYLPSYYSADTLILGCGNPLMGDDGFGPELVSYLAANVSMPDGVLALDTGMGVTRILLDLAIAPRKPRRLVVADAMRLGKPPGTVSLTSLDAFEVRPVRAFSAHQEPTSSLLRELGELGGIEVLLLTVEPERMPEEVSPGLSAAVGDAIVRACDLLRELC